MPSSFQAALIFALLISPGYERREKELRTLADELLDWVDSYRSPLAGRLGIPRIVPRLEPEPAAFLASNDRRSRALRSRARLLPARSGASSRLTRRKKRLANCRRWSIS